MDKKLLDILEPYEEEYIVFLRNKERIIRRFYLEQMQGSILISILNHSYQV